MLRHLDAAAISREPHLVWNAFIDLVAAEAYEDLSEIQRVAHLAFWYDAEVQNGGHYQYFTNPTGGRAAETVSALRSLRLEAHANLLEAAIADWQKAGRNAPVDVDEFVSGALEGKFDEVDSAYHECRPTIMDALQQFLSEHQPDFVVIDGGS